MKRLFKLAAAALALAMLLTSCGTAKNTYFAPDNTTYYGNERQGTGLIVTEDGIYYVSDDKTYKAAGDSFYTEVPPCLSYYDFETGSSVILCSDPNCTHTDYTTCPAAFKEPLGGLMLNSSKNCLQGICIGDSKVYSIELDGSGRESAAGLGLLSANGSVHYQGTYMLTDDYVFYSIFQKDGSAAIYSKPLYSDGEAQKIYETDTETETEDGYSIINYLFLFAASDGSLIFDEYNCVAAPTDVTEEDIGRPRFIDHLKCYNANTGEIETLAETYTTIVPYGDKNLLLSGDKLSVWDASTGEQTPMDMPAAAAELYEATGYSRLYYDDISDLYYWLFTKVSEEDGESTSAYTILVLDGKLNPKCTINCGSFLDGDLDFLQWNSTSLIAAGTDRTADHSQSAICILPKSEFENATEITWEADNVIAWR